MHVLSSKEIRAGDRDWGLLAYRGDVGADGLTRESVGKRRDPWELSGGAI